MTRTFLKKKIYPKKHLWSEIEVYTDSRNIQGDSTIIKNHPATLNLRLKIKTQGIHDCVQKTRVYTWILQSKPHVHVTMKQKLAYRKGLIFVVTLSVVVPQAIRIFLCNRIGDHIGEFLVIFIGGLYWHSMFLICSDFSVFESGLGACFLGSV